MKLIIILQVIFGFAYFAMCKAQPIDSGVGAVQTMVTNSFLYYELVNNPVCLSFAVRSPSHFHVTLSKNRWFNDFAIEFYMGTSDHNLSYMKRISATEKTISTDYIDTPNIISEQFYHSFWLSWNGNDGKFKLGAKGDKTPLMEWTEQGAYEVHYFGIRSTDLRAEFYFEEPICP